MKCEKEERKGITQKGWDRKNEEWEKKRNEEGEAKEGYVML